MKCKIFILIVIFISVNLYCQTKITMTKENGVYSIPCKINGLPLKLIFDTGASNVSISITEAMFMIKNGFLTKEDIGEDVYYKIANGDIAKGLKVNIKEIEFAGLKLYNVNATIINTANAPLLLGQSVIEKLGKIQLEGNKLTILNTSQSYDFESANEKVDKSYSQSLKVEFEKKLKKYSTNNHSKSQGLNIDIYYPDDWLKKEGKRPHILFNIENKDLSIFSSFLIKDVLESATQEIKDAIKIIGDDEVKKILLENFPNSQNCNEYFFDTGLENIKNPSCRLTKIEGLETSVASAYGTMKRAEFESKLYMIQYQILYKTKIINISFSFNKLENEKDRFLADHLAKKITNTILINNLWK